MFPSLAVFLAIRRASQCLLEIFSSISYALMCIGAAWFTSPQSNTNQRIEYAQSTRTS